MLLIMYTEYLFVIITIHFIGYKGNEINNYSNIKINFPCFIVIKEMKYLHYDT